MKHEEWLARLRAGDRAAFDCLVRQTHEAVFRLALRIVRHRADAQEVVQDAYLSAYQAIARFDGRAAPKSWLLAIAYRKALDLLRNRKASPWMIAGMLEDSDWWHDVRIVEHFTDWETNPEQVYGRAEMRALLDRALRRVPAASRAVLELRDLQGFSTKETAEILDSSEGAVRVRLHRVRQYLTSEFHALLGRGGPPS